MPSTLAFDVYGTLINTHGIVTHLKRLIGEQAMAFSQTWRDKQLEYSFRRGLMARYEPFPICTRQALDYCCAFYKAPLSETQRLELMQAYLALPAFEDVALGLEQLKAQGHRLYAFSNGPTQDVTTLLTQAGILDQFCDVISVDEVGTFKPSPTVYAHFLDRANSTTDDTWLISSNPFDVLGALSCDWNASWVKRSDQAILDPWDMPPSARISGLPDLIEILARND